MNLPGYTANASLDIRTGHYTSSEPDLCAIAHVSNQVIAQSTWTDLTNVYGNCCGIEKDCSGGSSQPIHKDLVDYACRDHDVCLKNTPFNHCECHSQIVSDLTAAMKTGRLSRRAKSATTLMIGVFSMMPCECRMTMPGVPKFQTRWCTGTESVFCGFRPCGWGICTKWCKRRYRRRCGFSLSSQPITFRVPMTAGLCRS